MSSINFIEQNTSKARVSTAIRCTSLVTRYNYDRLTRSVRLVHRVSLRRLIDLWLLGSLVQMSHL